MVLSDVGQATGIFPLEERANFVELLGEQPQHIVETDNATFTNTIVRKCGFHSFFQQNGRPELTRLLCDWDNNWSDVLEKNKQVQFSRPTTIAAGDRTCDFKFRKIV